MLPGGLDSFRGRIPQHQHRHLNACPAKLDRLIQKGDAQIVRAGLLQRPCHFHGAMAVSVRLDAGQQPHPFGKRMPECFIVLDEMIQIDFRPCCSILNLHFLQSPSLTFYAKLAH